MWKFNHLSVDLKDYNFYAALTFCPLFFSTQERLRRVSKGKSTGQLPDGWAGQLGCVRNLDRCWGQLPLMRDDVTHLNQFCKIITWSKLAIFHFFMLPFAQVKSVLICLRKSFSDWKRPSQPIHNNTHTIMYVPHPHRISTDQDVCLS